MSLPCPPVADPLRPPPEEALAAWAARCRADRAQVERCREIEDPADFYAPVATRFRVDPHRADDEVLDVLRGLGRPGDRWLDIGSGAGRYALPLALGVAEVVALDPSPSMLDGLAEGMREHGITNLTLVPGRWPASRAKVERMDVTLMAHVGYDIAEIGPFLRDAEVVTARRCVAVMGEGAMTTVATLFWEPIHGEPRVALPALPELLTLLVALGRLPEVRLTERPPVVFADLDELLGMARRQLWVRPGSSKDTRLGELVAATATRRDEGWSLDWRTTRVGVVWWAPTSRG